MEGPDFEPKITIDDRRTVFYLMVEHWHEDEETDLELHEYMGLTWEQYKVAFKRGYI